ncbi:MAG: hypothetical protein AB1715_14455, partial [Acidobacteriota bacterium]
MERRAERSRYFQGIARMFFDLRGAPFVLSSRDMVTISSWEEKRIPLRVVLEGIERAFENFRRRPVRSRKIPSLSFCEGEVLRAFAEFRDRRIGRESGKSSREAKRKKVKSEVTSFLGSLPPQVAYLEKVYRAALKILSRRNAAENELERLDEQAGALLVEHAVAEDLAGIEKRVKAEHSGRSAEELRQIAEVELVKWVRKKHRIPY